MLHLLSGAAFFFLFFFLFFFFLLKYSSSEQNFASDDTIGCAILMVADILRGKIVGFCFCPFP